jgi:hypothetical protein
MCEVCMNTSVHELSDWCVDSVWRHLYTSCQTDVWSLYGHICTPVVRLMCGVCMETLVWTHMYTSCQSKVWSLYSDICTPDNSLMCWVSMESSEHKLSDWSVESVWRHLYTSCQTDVWSLYGDTSVHKISDWCLESVWRPLYSSYQTDVWSLNSDISTPDIRMMFGVCLDISVQELDWCVDSV